MEEPGTVSDAHREKRNARLARHRRVRKSLHGTAERPRLSVYRSLNHIYAQLIDDDAAVTLASVSSLKMSAAAAPAGEQEGGKDGKKKGKPESAKIQRSRAVGAAIAEAAKAKGIQTVVFDRGGYLYHGRVAALAEAARKAGLEF
jgi:large subunit ribosomal protein L18